MNCQSAPGLDAYWLPCTAAPDSECSSYSKSPHSVSGKTRGGYHAFLGVL
ncbi:unnamed protein product [Staurois parvus]|uniref:Uncharacterized protein n=1 Tax=Staurois parvus TaxID=386267 RepID=A0ABN9DBG3_9NEOB|nr:unnamed protein product [Staurois parvus]